MITLEICTLSSNQRKLNNKSRLGEFFLRVKTGQTLESFL